MFSPTRLAQGRLHYGWIVMGITFLALLAAAGVRATPSVMIVPLEHEFGWNRAQISGAISINILLFGLVGPFSAALVDRYGLRRIVVLALAVLCMGVAMAPLVTKLWQFFVVWGVIIGLGSGMVANSLAALVANRWFSERRGLVTGILTTSTATGQLVFLPMLAAVIGIYGWRGAALTVAGTTALVLPIVGLLMRNRPQDIGLQPFGATTVETPPVTRGNPLLTPLLTLREVSRSRDFWLLFGTFFVCGASTNGLIGTHLISACVDSGITETKAAGLLAAIGVLDFFGTTGSGWLSDRLDNRLLLTWYYGLRGLSLLYLPFAFTDSIWGLPLFAVFYGLDWIATVPPTVKLAANVLGREKVGMVFGWIACGHQLGASVAALGAGALRNGLGDYQAAFMISGGVCIGAAALALAISPPGSAQAHNLVPAE
jgi:sugar phosphate permease